MLLDIIEGIKKLFNLGKKFFQKSHKLLTAAKGLLKEAGEKLKAGLEAAKTAATTAIEGVVKIDSMCFESSLSEAAKACVGFKLKATLLKTKEVNADVKACLDVSFPKQIAQAIADMMYPGIKTLKETIGNLKAKIGLVEKEKDQVEATADEVNKACKDDDKSCGSSRDIIWTEEEKYYRKLAYEQLPRYTVRDDVTMKAFERDTPSQKAATEDPLAKAHIQNPKNFIVVAKKRESVAGMRSIKKAVWLFHSGGL